MSTAAAPAESAAASMLTSKRLVLKQVMISLLECLPMRNRFRRALNDSNVTLS
jgi:hypothetical protein